MKLSNNSLLIILFVVTVYSTNLGIGANKEEIIKYNLHMYNSFVLAIDYGRFRMDPIISAVKIHIVHIMVA